ENCGSKETVPSHDLQCTRTNYLDKTTKYRDYEISYNSFVNNKQTSGVDILKSMALRQFVYIEIKLNYALYNIKGEIIDIIVNKGCEYIPITNNEKSYIFNSKKVNNYYIYTLILPPCSKDRTTLVKCTYYLHIEL